MAAVGTVHAQISPGPLSSAHQSLEGLTNCTKCHSFGSGARELKCLDCHTEIQRRLKAGTGYHARLKAGNAAAFSCAKCHAEHSGKAFNLVRFDRKAFDHGAETGFALQGKHRSVACEKCHNSGKIAESLRGEIKLKDLNHTFLGLRRECSTCHADQHQGRLGTNCARCHSSESWKTVAGFDHSETRFALTGLHKTVACAKCHVQGPDGRTQFQGLAFATCDNCHKDPHGGAFRAAKFQGSCDGCHSTAGWKKARPSPEFRHDRTRFALVGKHAEVACNRCHKGADFRHPVPHERCQDCHSDPHRGQFATRAAGSDCSSCHSERDFKPARFDIVAHQASAFPLTGKHASVDCARCHRPAGKDTVFRTGNLKCLQCHEDVHQGVFAAAPSKGQCDACHTDKGFRPSTFDVAKHSATRFPLKGKHASVDCARCHRPLSAPQPLPAKPASGIEYQGARRQFHFESLKCSACHSDPHDSRLECETCHDANAWKPTSAFDHSRTRFALESGHAKAPCGRCHASAAAGKPPLFRVADSRCASCHMAADRHKGQFLEAARSRDCADCHRVASWKIDSFDHDLTTFPLDRAHRNVACEKCHKEQMVEKVMIRRYRGTPARCVECH